MTAWGLCANVRELSESEEFEVAVVDAFSGDVVSQSFSTKEVAVKNDYPIPIWPFPSIEDLIVHPFKASSVGLPFNRVR
jgi:hypothetical protein